MLPCKASLTPPSLWLVNASESLCRDLTPLNVRGYCGHLHRELARDQRGRESCGINGLKNEQGSSDSLEVLPGESEFLHNFSGFGRLTFSTPGYQSRGSAAAGRNSNLLKRTSLPSTSSAFSQSERITKGLLQSSPRSPGSSFRNRGAAQDDSSPPELRSGAEASERYVARARPLQ